MALINRKPILVYQTPAAQSAHIVDLSLLIPCYDEESNIESAIDTVVKACALANKSYEILVIDDGSKDQTLKVAENYARSHPTYSLKIFRNPMNFGLAVSYVEGAFLGTGKYYRICCADTPQPMESLAKVFALAGKADIVAPIEPHVEGRELSRHLLSRSFTFIVNLLSGHSLRYYNGCSLIERENVKRWHSYSTGFGFQADMIARMLDHGATVMEVEVAAVNRSQGKSKAIKLKNFLSVLHVFIGVVVRRLSRARAAQK